MKKEECLAYYKKYSYLKYPDLIRKAIDIEMDSKCRSVAINSTRMYVNRKRLLVKLKNQMQESLAKLHDDNSSLKEIFDTHGFMWRSMTQKEYTLIDEICKIKHEIKQLDTLYCFSKSTNYNLKEDC